MARVTHVVRVEGGWRLHAERPARRWRWLLTFATLAALAGAITLLHPGLAFGLGAPMVSQATALLCLAGCFVLGCQFTPTETAPGIVLTDAAVVALAGQADVDLDGLIAFQIEPRAEPYHLDADTWTKIAKAAGAGN